MLKVIVPSVTRFANLNFAQGYERGIAWYNLKEWDGPTLNEEYLLTNIEWICNKGLHKSPEDLAWHIGFIFAMYMSSFNEVDS